MKKILFLLSLLLFLNSPGTTHAALVNITESGNITVNVLSATAEGLTVKKIANANYHAENSNIKLSNENGKLELNLESDSGNKNLDITGLEQDLIELEKFVAPQTIKISALNNVFTIAQSQVSATTSYPIEVNTKDKQILVKSPKGYEYLKTLPLDVQNSLQILDLITKLDSLTLVQNDAGELVYLSSGEKIFNLFDLYELKIPVQADVSVATGKISNIKAPIWYKIIGLILV